MSFFRRSLQHGWRQNPAIECLFALVSRDAPRLGSRLPTAEAERLSLLFDLDEP